MTRSLRSIVWLSIISGSIDPAIPALNVARSEKVVLPPTVTPLSSFACVITLLFCF